ncbi:large ribosomal subunit protein bL27m [Trichomonascus vanleenenianus]|uniref:mitochondrial 54S ribosomal protein bL27m MRP7 n=1 Tax=Trichomonascus vanleenenianus TaxID=2268995 RepID=UPI003EC9F5DA
MLRSLFRQSDGLSAARAILQKPVVSSPVLTFVRTATKRAAGSKTSMKDSAGRRLGAKKGDGQLVKVGEIVYRQRGTKIYPGENMGIGRDHTLFALEPGYVRFYLDPFHPQRKLAGIAMRKDTRLPTPHFAPRMRRFGQSTIVEPEKAEREKNVMKRKEFIGRPKLEEELQKREQKRIARKDALGKELDKHIVLEGADREVALERLLSIRSFLCHGRTIQEARELADKDYVSEAEIAKKYRKDSSLVDGLDKYKELASKVDAAVSFCPEGKLYKALTQAELDEIANSTISEIEKLTAGVITKDIRAQVKELLRKPCFELTSRHALYKRYAYKPIELPQVSKEDMQKLVKQKKGKIVQKWNYEKRRVDKVFVPFELTA